MMNRDDAEPLEKEFAASLGAPLDELRARRAHCPPLEMLRAAAGDTLHAERKAQLEEHVRACPLCRALAADLQDDELAGPSPAEARRIRARVEVGMGDTVRGAEPVARRGAPGFRAWIAGPALAFAVVAFILWNVHIASRRQDAPPPAQQPPTQQPSHVAQIPAALRLEMPEVKLSAAAVLVTRGSGDAQQYLEDLAPGLGAYRAENYTEAAQGFSALEGKYPEAIEVFFYGGVSRLHEGANDAAVRSLERARALNEPAFADDVAWCLGLAYHRAGQIAAARAEFDRLCAGKSAFSPRACDAAKELAGAAEPEAAR